MSKKNTDREQLLAETYHGDWSSGPASRFASRAATAARRRRMLERVTLGSAVTLLVVAAVIVTTRRTPSAPHVTLAANRSEAVSTYETISDAQLLALVTDRPLLLIQNGADSARTIVTFGP